MNKKIRNIIIAIVLVFIIAVIIAYAIDMHMMKQGKAVIFSTWGNLYSPKINSLEEDNSNQNSTEIDNKKSRYIALEELSQDYNYQQAIQDGCFVILSGQLYNKEQSEIFISQVNSNKVAELRILQFTIEGDTIITDIKYDENKFIVLQDSTRDKFSAEDDRKIKADEYSKEEYNLLMENYIPEENKQIQYEEIYLAKKDNENEKILLYSYNNNLENLNLYELPYFYGTIQEVKQNHILVEADEKEDETQRNIKDLYSVPLDKNNDMIYEVGTRVKVTHTGSVLEVYPAKVDTIRIEIKSCEEFELKYHQRKDEGIYKIIDKNTTDLYDYDVYTFGGDVTIVIDEKEYDLSEAILQNKIRVEEIIQKANDDLEKGNIKGNEYNDGGSIIYNYDNYNILKIHNLNGNRDVYIGNSQMNINDVI